MMNEKFVESTHTPPHHFRPETIYLITGATYQQRDLIKTDEKKRYLLNTLEYQSAILKWELEAWSIFSNHYHFVARAPKDSSSLSSLIQAIHSISAKYFNQQDNIPGRQVWFNYWDACLTSEASYLARLHYVLMNSVKHGYVDKPEDYEFCSYSWFMDEAAPAFREKVFAQPIDRISVYDVE